MMIFRVDTESLALAAIIPRHRARGKLSPVLAEERVG
jgi:hypothetical protein